MIDWTKTVTTSSGQVCKVLSTEIDGEYPVAVVVRYAHGECVVPALLDGRVSLCDTEPMFSNTTVQTGFVVLDITDYDVTPMYWSATKEGAEAYVKRYGVHDPVIVQLHEWKLPE